VEATEPGLELRQIRVEEPGFRPLFEGDSLEGWEIRQRGDHRGGWNVEDGILYCEGGKSHWLQSPDKYSDLVIRLEYQLAVKGNSGIYLRAPKHGWVSKIGLEIQLLDDENYKGKIRPYQRCGSVYGSIVPETRVPAPAEQWNAIEVLLSGQRVRTVLNGVELYDTTLDQAAEDTRDNVTQPASRALQDHQTGVRFRHVRIRPLNPTTQSQPAGTDAE